MELYLDSNEAKNRVRAGDADAPGMGAPVRTQAIDTRQLPDVKFSDFGYSVISPTTLAQTPASSASLQQQPAPPKPATFEDFGYSAAIKLPQPPAPAPAAAAS